jgi:hypothetical protein
MTVTVNFFFIHSSSMKEREVTMNNFRSGLANHTFKDGFKLGKVATVESFDPNTIDGRIIQNTVNYTPFEDSSPYAKYNTFRRNLHIYQLSNALKHVKVLEVAAGQTGENINIIMEDDVSFDPSNVFKNIESAIAKYTAGSILFLGLPNNGRQVPAGQYEAVPTREFFEVIPYNDSYMVDGEAAKKLFDAFMPIRFITNINMNLAIEKSGVKSFQTVPNVFVDGSKIGIFTSSLNPNNVLMFNADYMKLREIATKAADVTSEEKGIVEKICAQSPCAQHPDFQYMRALFLQKTGDFKEAAKTYQTAHEIYERNTCIINHESAFLKDYIKVFKHLQPQVVEA